MLAIIPERKSTLFRRPLSMYVKADSYIRYIEVPQVATAPDWSHFPITGLSLAASLLIIEVRKGVPRLPRCRETLTPSTDSTTNISCAVYHMERSDIDSEYTATRNHDCFLSRCFEC
jgi:hypothetical protein